MPVGYILSAIHVESNKIDFTVAEFFYVIWGSIERDAKFFKDFVHFWRQLTLKRWCQNHAIGEKVCVSKYVIGVLGCRVEFDNAAIVDGADDAVVAHLTICSDCECACAHQVVLKLHVRLNIERSIGGIVAQHVYAVAVEMRLVNGSPDFDAVSKALKANLGVFAEPLCHVVVQPSAFASKREWQIVMEQRNVGLYAIFEAAINDPIIKIDTLFIHFADTGGDDSTP